MREKTGERYDPTSIALHWLMLLLLAAVYACIELRELYPKGSEIREALKTWHYMLGLSVFVLVWLRLALRISAPGPRVAVGESKWQRRAAALMHLALYALMIGLPLAGWLVLSAEGKTVPFFGLHLPALIGENKALAKQIEEIHETVGTLGYYLIGLHAAAALFHHYVLRDDTLVRMLPRSAAKDVSARR